MIVLSIISCMALLFSRYYPKKNVSIGLKWAFILLALVSGIRYNYGNDYINYLYAYNVISRATSPFSISISNGIYNPQIQISVVSGTKRSIFRQKNKTKRSKKKAAHNTYKAGAKG